MTWPKPWRALRDEDEAQGLERQLAVECAAQHPLFRQRVQAIARCEANDDVLFQLEDGRVAKVHLTWRGDVETVMPETFPATEIHPTKADARAAIIEEYAGWED